MNATIVREAKASVTRPQSTSAWLWLRRAAGLLVTALATLPVYQVLAQPRTGRAGWLTGELVAVFSSFAWSGALLVTAAALLAARFLEPDSGVRLLQAGRRLLLRPSSLSFALLVALFAGVLTALFSLLVLNGKPNMIDAIVQALHARFLADGRLAGPADELNAFWHIQNSVITEHGWVSQYPPGHLFLLAGAMLLGVPWLPGPLLVATLVFCTSFLAERIWPNEPGAARLSALLTACSTFIICIGASYLNHVPAAALLAAAAFAMLRARHGHVLWAVLAGLSVGSAFAMRPLTALSVGFAVGLAAWLDLSGGWRLAFARMTRLGVAAAVGAAVPALLVLAYNAHFFGSPFTFGYNVALGPRMGLGFGIDPWGNFYGPLEALGYTSSDLTTLGVALLETPFSSVLVVGAFLLLVPRLNVGERVLVAWALAPVAANALYWHHGIYMGPRMLYEAAPAWVLLFTIACVRAWQFAPMQWSRLPMYSPRMAVAGGTAFMLLFGFLYLAPQRAASYGGDWLVITRMEPPQPPGPAVVFVHDAWIARLGMQLAAGGMRLDSVETAIRQNPTCRVQQLVNARLANVNEAYTRTLSSLDMEPRAHRLPPIARISTGNTMRLSPDGQLTGDCARQIYADRLGILDIAPLVWQGDLPGAPARGALFVRDLGPELNARLLARMPERSAWMFITPNDEADPVLLPYQEAVQLLWAPPNTPVSLPRLTPLRQRGSP